MELYLHKTKVPTAVPSQGSNELQALKEEIKGLQERNKDLSEKLTLLEAKSTQTVKTGEASSSRAKSKLTITDLNWDEEGNWAKMPEDEDPFIAEN